MASSDPFAWTTAVCLFLGIGAVVFFAWLGRGR